MIPPAVRLAIGPANYARQAHEWARAAREVLGIAAWSFSRTADASFGFPADRMLAPRSGSTERRQPVTSPQVWPSIDGASHVALDGFLALSGSVLTGSVRRDVRELRGLGIQVALIAHGSDVRDPANHLRRVPDSWFRHAGRGYVLAHRASSARNRRLARSLGCPLYVSTPDLLHDLPEATWLPVTIEPSDWTGGEPVLQTPRPRVLHVPSKRRPAIKGTAEISPILRRLHGEGLIEYLEPDRMSHAELVSTVKSVDIVVDQVLSDQYGVTSVEAMAAGRLALCSVLDTRRLLPEDPPIVDVIPATIEQVLRDIVADRARFAEVAAGGPGYVGRWHGGTAAARALQPWCAPTPSTEAAGEPAGSRGPGSVDIVIATHTTDRPIDRAVRSVLSDPHPDTRAIVVCHELPVAAVRDLLSDTDLSRVDLIAHSDGLRSPGGPFNAGLAASTAELVGVMGSDDYLSPGAVSHWAGLLRTGDDAAIAKVTYQAGGLMRTPAIRFGRRTERLCAARDRLFYRTAPLGLFRRSTITKLGLRFTEGVPTGEDLAFGMRLWTSSRRIHYAGRGPSYVVGGDAPTRITSTPRPVAVDLTPCSQVVVEPWFTGLPADTRRAAVVKLLRIHLFGAVGNRSGSPESWTDRERADLALHARSILAGAPAALNALSRSEYRLWRATIDPGVPTAELLAAAAARSRHGRPATVITWQPWRVLDRQAPLRLMAASLLMR